ncbi:hypothetical protein LAZ67_9002634 [Cordylochernes scorpioides]|uniref:Uncharacterized protein n=1 Tax=Cordylochernes scorpioides TaxID=51811 RepID=A0ABY6KVL8_9ARAC|nr:hypothetical protein LAZ67_9002634 [Cordylochernes scorpioides]
MKTWRVRGIGWIVWEMTIFSGSSLWIVAGEPGRLTKAQGRLREVEEFSFHKKKSCRVRRKVPRIEQQLGIKASSEDIMSEEAVCLATGRNSDRHKGNEFVKALDKDGEFFKYICRFYPDISLEIITAGVFDGPNIKRFLNDKSFLITMNGIEEAAWSGFKAVVHGIF